jgi:hypothetical protein
MSEPDPSHVVAALDRFLDRLTGVVGPGTVESVLTGDRLMASLDLDAEPGAFTERHLVEPLAQSVGLALERRERDRNAIGPGEEHRRLAGLEPPVVVETSALGDVDEASEAIREAVGPFESPEYGLATDGTVWRLHRAERRGDATRFPVVSAVDLGDALRETAVDRGRVGDARSGTAKAGDAPDATRAAVREAIEDVRLAAAGGPRAEAARSRIPDRRSEPHWSATAFAVQFAPEPLGRRLDRVPQERREHRRETVERFYDRYVDRLFGEGAGGDCGDVLSALVPPDGHDPPGAERRSFALALVNRLLFVRFLEERDGTAIPDGVLADRLDAYEASSSAESFYRAEIRPLFETLRGAQATDRGRRSPDSGPQQTEVPALGGPFHPSVPHEGDYDVRDGVLEGLVAELLGEEADVDVDGGRQGGSGLSTGGRIDPSVLGAAFEKVINHLGAKPDVGLQRAELGAVYTPPDVTERVTAETVDPAIADRLVETLLEAVEGGARARAAARSHLSDCDLGALLDQFAAATDVVVRADGGPVTIPFSEETAEAALEAVTDVRVLDPACGSGHFLTVAMDRLHRAQRRLLTGAKGGRAPTPRERYEARRALALEGIYGVDVHGAAVDIARLRVWFGLLGDGGWEPGDGPLPPVDANLVCGNALVGLPVTGTVEGDGHEHTVVRREAVERADQHRRRYKFGPAAGGREVEPRERGPPTSGDATSPAGRDVVRRFLDDGVVADLDRAYVTSLGEETLEESLGSPEALRDVTDAARERGGEGLSPALRRVTARPDDGGEFTPSQLAVLERAGFDVAHTGTTATLDVAARERALAGGADSPADRLVDDLSAVLRSEVTFTRVRRRPLSVDLGRATGRPLHWAAAFPELATPTGEGHAGPIGFDVVLGNPPYGDLLSDAEKRLLSPMQTGTGYDDLERGEVACAFLERAFDLLADDGYLGNVVTVGVLSNSERRAVHELIEDRFASATVSSFARRPAQVFDRAGSRVEINPTILTGRLGNADADGSYAGGAAGGRSGVRSGDFVRFSASTRAAAITDHETSPVDGLYLRDRLGSDSAEAGVHVFPKVGGDTKHAILETLADTPRQVGDWLVEASPHRLRHRRSFNYWLVATRGDDDLRNMHEYCFADRLTRDFAYLAANSSLLYAYHMTYGNMQDFGRARFERFPVPRREDVEAWGPLVRAYADALEAGLAREVRSTGTVDYTGTGEVKELVDETEFLLGAVYGLEPEEVRFLQTYDAAFARRGPGEYDPVPEHVGDGSATRVGFGPERDRKGATDPPF